MKFKKNHQSDNMNRMIIFWLLLFFSLVWGVGALTFFYHGFTFRYPKDIIPAILFAFVLAVFPLLILLVGFLADAYGGL